MNKQKQEKGKITGKTTFAELLSKHPDTAELLFSSGLHCIGCPMAQQETIEQGILAHGLNKKDVEKVIEEINEKISKKQNKK